MKYTLESVRERYNSGEKFNIIPFWGHSHCPDAINKSCLSQWYDCRFEADGTVYHTTEQYMMSEKAKVFGDKETYDKIMAAVDPSEYKATPHNSRRTPCSNIIPS